MEHHVVTAVLRKLFYECSLKLQVYLIEHIPRYLLMLFLQAFFNLN